MFRMRTDAGKNDLPPVVNLLSIFLLPKEMEQGMV
jgi:hypothetical protein